MYTDYDFEMLHEGMMAEDKNAKVVRYEFSHNEIVAYADNGLYYVWDGLDVTSYFIEEEEEDN